MKERVNAEKAYARRAGLVLFLGCGLLLLAACTGGGQEAIATATVAPAEATLSPEDSQPTRGQAIVQSIDVLIMESFPVQVSVTASGSLPDGCTQIDEVISQRTDNAFRVAITTLRQPSAICTQALVPFEESVPLDVAGLPAGTYEVTVNGVSDSFTLDVDNILPEEEATEGTTGAGAAVAPGISGFVWHDLCTQTGTTVDPAATPAEGCVAAPGGATLQADGVRDAGEPGIPGVTITLFAGDCTAAAPGDEIVTTTDESGAFRFEGLSPDTYCVFLDTTTEANVAALEEGVITFPISNGVPTNSITVTLEEGAALEDVDFGFDFRFLPVAAAPTNCTNSFEFLLDLTIPDDTVFPPGAEFEAAWRLRNNGTCPWDDYALAFVNGDAMGITGTVPIEDTVAPGQSADVSVTLTAPATPGTYRSNWQLADAAGTVFGINGQAEDAFWVQIVVEEGAETAGPPAPGSASISGVVWDDVCTLTNNTASRGCVETEEGSGFFRGNGTFDTNEVGLPGITVVLGQGACPPGGIIAVADRLATAITDADGLYRFEALDADIYCVSIDALSPENVDLLIPGNWTWPAPGTGRQGIRLAGGEQREAVDFGWDFQE